MDYLIRGTLKKFPVRFFIANTTKTVENMNLIHNTTPTSSAAAGRVLTATVLMGSMLKNRSDKLSIIIEGDGKLNKVIATSGNDLKVKCEIYNPNVGLMINKFDKIDVAKAVGKGFLTVTYDSGEKEPYSGKTELITSEIGEDIAYYYLKSEQIPSVVSLGVLIDRETKIKSAGGFIIQIMPDCSEDIINFLEKRVNSIQSISQLIDSGMSCEEISKEIFKDYEFNIHENNSIEYFCDCSKTKVEKVLISLGKNKLNEIIYEDKKIEVKCHFCNTTYNFNEIDIHNLLKTI
ncbi:MAG: Hsp33 family molecular chaperone HslO [Clostridiales bacterium]